MASFDDCITYAKNEIGVSDLSLKDKQTDTLKALYAGEDCISILPTGFGKSLTFQLLPWFFQKKYGAPRPLITIVVSPLNSLMEDQVFDLCKKGISACFLNIHGSVGKTYTLQDNNDLSESPADIEMLESTDSVYASKNVPSSDLDNGNINIIYAHPETLVNKKIGALLRSHVYQTCVCAVIVDEVHMVSVWGKEFRPAFNSVGELTCIFPKAAHLALTATATQQSIEELRIHLHYQNPKIITVNPDRTNIYLEVRESLPNMKKTSKIDSLILPIIEELKLKMLTFPLTIIYIDNLEVLGYCYQYIAHELKDVAYIGDHIPENRIFAQYHKDYTDDMKRIIVQDLVKETPKLRLVLATVALGMGLNAPSIQRIIHFRPPTSLEKYAQEIGRAGRKGQTSEAILYYNNSDIAKNRKGLHPVAPPSQYIDIQKLHPVAPPSQYIDIQTLHPVAPPSQYIDIQRLHPVAPPSQYIDIQKLHPVAPPSQYIDIQKLHPVAPPSQYIDIQKLHPVAPPSQYIDIQKLHKVASPSQYVHSLVSLVCTEPAKLRRFGLK